MKSSFGSGGGASSPAQQQNSSTSSSDSTSGDDSSNAFHVAQAQSRVLYTCEPGFHVGCYSASINAEHTILALTKCHSDKNMYETHFVPLDDLKRGFQSIPLSGGKSFLHAADSDQTCVVSGSRVVAFQSPSPLQQNHTSLTPSKLHVQFIHHLQATSTRHSSSSAHYYIRFIAGEVVRLLEIETRIDRKTKLMNIQKHNALLSLLKNGYFWASWDGDRSLLYSLERSRTANAPGSSSPRSIHSSRHSKDILCECVLKCFDLSLLISSLVVSNQRKNILQFEYSLHMKIPRSAIMELDNHLPRRDGWNDLRSYSHRDLKLHVIHLDSDSLCLCQQHLTVTRQGDDQNSSETYIPITIYSLNHRQKIKLQIPLPADYVQTNVQQTKDSSTTTDTSSQRLPMEPNVLFTTCKSLLIVHLPDVFMEIFDLSCEHDPWPIARFTDPNSLPSFASSLYDYQNITSIQDAQYNSYLFDHTNGSVYKWKFSMESIQDNYLPTLKTLDPFLKILHVILVHFSSEYEQMPLLMAGFRSLKHVHLGEIITEYIAGASYALASGIIRDKSFLQLIPMSLLENQPAPHYFQGNEQIEKIGGALFEASARLSRRVRTFCLFDQLQMTQANDVTVLRKVTEMRQNLTKSMTTPKQNTSYFRSNLFSFFLASKKDEGVEEPAEEPNTFHVLKESFVDNVQLLLTQNAPYHLNGRIAKYSTDYCTILLDEFKNCFQEIERFVNWGKPKGERERHHKTDARPPKLGFAFMQGLYMSLERTGMPPPDGFVEQFASMGLKVLPRRIFVDYVDRDVFWVTKNLIDEIKEEQACGVPCDEYLGLLVRKFHQKTVELTHYQHMQPLGLSYVLAFYSSKLKFVKHDPKTIASDFQNQDNTTGIESLDFLCMSWDAHLDPLLREANNTRMSSPARPVDKATRYKVRYLKKHCIRELRESVNELSHIEQAQHDPHDINDAAS